MILHHGGEHILYWKFQTLSLEGQSAQTCVITTSCKLTIASLELVITRRRDGVAVHVCAIRRFKVDHKRPSQRQLAHRQQGKKNLLYGAF